jgi:putative transposase
MTLVEIQNRLKKYHSNGRMLYSYQYHIIFCPKYRRDVLVGGVAKRLKQLIIERQKEYGYEVLDIEIMPNHVHMLLDIDPKKRVVTAVNMIKGYTSHWTNSKFISSVGAVTLEAVKKHIEDQKGV